jgi:two-component system, cell cycle response regulator
MATSDSKPERETLWSRLREPPDQLMVEAGASGELLVARIRLLVAIMLLLIPIVTLSAAPQNWESLVGIGAALAAFLLCVGVYLLVIRDAQRPWLGFVTSAFDVTLVSGTLATFLFFNRPHTAVNSKVIFEIYLLAIAATSLRYDVRVCLMAGLLALCEYAAIVTYAATRWRLNDPGYAPFSYGMFSWAAQISRMIVVLIATVLSAAVVLRARRLRQLSMSDRLTGLFNRAYFDERVAAEVSRASRHARPLAVAMIDVDHFKSFNDTHGHTAGDAALCAVASTLRRAFRRSDVVARYGGEEFIVLLPDTDIETATDKLEAIRRMVSETPIDIRKKKEQMRLTISIGVACLPTDGLVGDDLVNVADARLFQAKRSGRNRLVGDDIRTT